jgi:serine-type D-Ala-D-Ala endopeptidase (penicillin-binding protein 7)
MNFLQIESTSQKKNPQVGDKLRNLIMASILFGVVGIGIGSIMFTSSGSIISSMEEVAKKTFPFAEDIELVKAGGDVVVEPVYVPQPPTLTGALVDASTFGSQALLIKDVESGALLYEKRAYDAWPIASITKLMSALVILEKTPDWTTSTQVISDDVVDTHMYAGDTYTLEELWRAALVGSSNKAILTLSDAVGWPRDAFIERMNQKARELGMADSHFTDPSGLNEGNVATPSDILLLLSEALSREKVQDTLLLNEHQLYSNERKKPHHMWNTNWLLLGWITHGFGDIIGGKTGYIDASGYNFTARVSDATGHHIDIVVLGAATHEDRFTIFRDAGEWAYDNYTWDDEEENVSL